MLRRKQHRSRTIMPKTPRMLSPDEIFIIEPVDQIDHLLKQMNRHIPENPVTDSNILAMTQ